MNQQVHALYAEYLSHTSGDKAAAASLTLADVLQRTLDARLPFESTKPAIEANRPMTVPEIAKFLRVKPQTVLCWVHSGDLIAANVAPRSGGQPRYRVAPADLAAFQRQRGATTPSDAPRRAIRRGRPFAQPRHPTT
jgi:hypothetical protein